jgi:hypothetical protein
VVVEEVTDGGNASAAGVQPGDVLSEVSAVVLKNDAKSGEFEAEGYGKRPYTNWAKTQFNCEGENFNVVMNAIKSNNERWGFNSVDLVIRRPGDA